MKYIYPKDEAKTIHKFGVDITIFGADAPSGVVYEETETGHLQEWYDDVSTYHWYIIEGSGMFSINNEKHVVHAGDLVVVPPKSRIHYFGKMKMILVTTPKFDPENEHEVRIVDASEAPL